jgi:hypothetical protein
MKSTLIPWNEPDPAATLIGHRAVAVPLPSEWSVARAEITRPASPGLVGAIDRLDSPRQLVSRFGWLRHHSPPVAATPPLLMVFDCLYARAGKDLRSRPLHVRRNVLEDMLDEQDLVLPVRRLADDGLKAWREVVERGYKVKQPKYRDGVGGSRRTRRSPHGRPPWCRFDSLAAPSHPLGGGRDGRANVPREACLGIQDIVPAAALYEGGHRESNVLPVFVSC